MAITVPYRFQDCPMEHLVSMVSDMLERLLRHNDQIPLHPDALTRFHSRTAPSISVRDYLRRVVRYTNLERSCLLITLHYIDQMCGRLPRFTISSLTVHRFLIACVCVSTKALCDAFCTNSHYAKIGGIRVAELNVLEREFLSALDWHLICTPELLQEYYVNLARSHSGGAFEVQDETIAAPAPATGEDTPSSPGRSPTSLSERSSDQTVLAESVTSTSDAAVEDRFGKSFAIRTETVLLDTHPAPRVVSHASVAIPPPSPSYSATRHADIPMAASSTFSTSSIPRASSMSPNPAPSTPRKRPRQSGVSSMIDRLDIASVAQRRRVKAPIPAEAAG